ncbi:hypothetical protein D3C79_966470 [compost metagenome]
MAQGVHCDTAGKIDQLATGLVPDPGTLATHRDESGGGIVGNHHLVEIGALDLRMLNGHQFLLP